jgi:Flp pilus assembly pilin Flp
MKFLREKQSQAAIEYILLVGGVILAAVVVASIYSEMVRNTGRTFTESAGNVTNATKYRVMRLLRRI